MISAAGIIPVRYESRRFPGKPLALIKGKPMVQWVWERAARAKFLDRILIATDDERIYRAAESFGADVVMTSPQHASGTERVAEAAAELASPIVINIQGDEPLLQPDTLDALVNGLQDPEVTMATLAVKRESADALADPNIVKVVVDGRGFALYFSRSPIPFGESKKFLQHIGIYGFKRDFLLRFSRLSPSRLEKIERLEQLRALENGFPIKVLETSYLSLSVDTPEDIIKVESFLEEGRYDE